MWDSKISIPTVKNLRFIAQMHQNSVFFIFLGLIIYYHGLSSRST